MTTFLLRLKYYYVYHTLSYFICLVLLNPLYSHHPSQISSSSQTLAAELKRQLDEARNLKSSAGQLPQGGVAVRPGTEDGSKEGEEVLLTRTDRSGMVRPLPTREYPDETQGGRRRKKQKVGKCCDFCVLGKFSSTPWFS